MGAEIKHESIRTTFRPLRPEDAPAVAEILQGTPEASNWSEKSCRETLNWRGIAALVGEDQGKITSFIIGNQVADEAEILNLAVVPARRRKGEGSALLKAMLKELQLRRVTRVYLEVRESNATGIAFYAKHGFSKTGRRPKYYRDPDEAAVVMEKKLKH